MRTRMTTERARTQGLPHNLKAIQMIQIEISSGTCDLALKASTERIN